MTGLPSAYRSMILLDKGCLIFLASADRNPAGAQIEPRENFWLLLGEIPLESGTTNFRTGVCSTEL